MNNPSIQWLKITITYFHTSVGWLGLPGLDWAEVWQLCSASCISHPPPWGYLGRTLLVMVTAQDIRQNYAYCLEV